MSYKSGNPRHARRAELPSAPEEKVHLGLPDSTASSDGSFSRYSRYSQDREEAGIADNVLSGSSAIAAARKSRKKHRRKIMAVVISCLVLVLGCAGAAFAYIGNLNANIHRGLDNSLLDVLMPVDTPEDPFYVLLLGTDSSLERIKSGDFGSAFRSDSMILARINPKNKKVALLSIPRDTKVNLGEHGEQKINAAHAFGGPSLAVKTVSELTGVPISHYAEIDFDGFSSVVDALGGIEVNVPMQIDDDMAGGHVDSGLQTLNGEQALIMCRSRHNYDDYGNGDALRTANQRLVLSAIAQKLLSADPISMANTVTKLTEAVLTDMDVAQIVNIAQSMRGLNASADFYTSVIPTQSKVIGGIWYDILDEQGMKAMIKRMDQGLPPTEEDEVDAATGIVTSSTGAEDGEAAKAFNKTNYNITKNATINVRNGNGVEGLGSQVKDVLTSMGYLGSNINVANANSTDFDSTLIVFKDADKAEEAKMIADALGCGRAVRDMDTYLFDSDYLIVIGADWQ